MDREDTVERRATRRGLEWSRDNHCEHSPPWHTLESRAVAEELSSDAKFGLTDREVRSRLERWGPNRLEASKGRSVLEMIIDQFKSLIVVMLLAATAVAFSMGEHLEAVAILVVVVINALIGLCTELSAGKALSALQRQSVPEAQVVRDGKEQRVEAASLVPGDAVVLAAGVRVPADGRVIESVELQADEAPLTGESVPVEKDSAVLEDPETPLAERLNMAFMGTTVTDGRGRLLVTATGKHTEIGRIGTLVEEAEKDTSPLERRLAQLGRSLVLIVLGLCAIIVVTGYLQGNPFLYMLEVGISLAIAAVPEGLPAVATMTLAIGMLRMARQRALVRRLPAVETLGSTTVICTDKTGTITRNEMMVTRLVLADREIEITGRGYEPQGEFRENGSSLDPATDDLVRRALQIAAQCNDAEIQEQDGRFSILGDPTEGALLVAARKAGVDRKSLDQHEERVGELPFDSEEKRMATVHRAGSGRRIVYVKGSPGVLLDRSRSFLAKGGVEELTEERRKRILDDNNRLATEALRVLALAYRELSEDDGEEDVDRDLVFVALAGMRDPLREEAKEAIATCREAGIRVVMLTGDQLETAAAIARQLEIDRDTGGRKREILHARDLQGLDADGWAAAAGRAAGFARVTPEHKLRIVEALQNKGEVVAMTGDGVNDAPALKKADIGVAMGIKGTEVAKEAADMVITDDNFATIVLAVEQGRIIYANIVKFIHYLFSCNFAEILTVFVAILIGWPSPLAPLQILWLNIITDVFPAMALALEPSAPNMMQRPPRDPREAILRPRFVGLLAWQGAMLAGLTLVAFYWALERHGAEDGGIVEARTVAFLTLALGQVFHALNARSRRESVFNRRLFSNAWLWAALLLCIALQVIAVGTPFFQEVLRTTVPDVEGVYVVTACTLAAVLIVELVKLADRRWGTTR